MELEFEPDWGELASATSQPPPSNLKPKPARRRHKKPAINDLDEHSMTTRSVVAEDDFYNAAKAFVQAKDAASIQETETPRSSADVAIRLPPLPTRVPLLPPPPKRSMWAELGGPLPDISVLEDRLLDLQQNRLHPRPKPARKVPKERNMGVELCFAAHSCDVEAAEALLENRANPNFLDFSRRTPLHLAASAGCVPIISLLLQFGADISLVGGASSLTALHFAAEAGHEEVVRLLCARGADLEALSLASGEFAPVPTGFTALAIACERAHFEAVVALCEAKADLHSTMGSQGRTPLHLAASNNQLSTPQIVAYLVARGADCSIRVHSENIQKSAPSPPPSSIMDREALVPLFAPDEDEPRDDIEEQQGRADFEEEDGSIQQPTQLLEGDSDGELDMELQFLSLWDHPSADVREALTNGLLEFRKNLDDILLPDFAISPLSVLSPAVVAHVLDYLCVPGLGLAVTADETEELDPLQNDTYENLWE